MSPPRHNRYQSLTRYPDGSWGIDTYVDGRRVRKKVGTEHQARVALAKLKGLQPLKHDHTAEAANLSFGPIHRALAILADQVAAVQDQLAASRERERLARMALARLIQSATTDPGDLAAELTFAEQTLEQLYTDAE